MLTYAEIRKMNARELEEELKKGNIEFLKLRLSLASRQLKNTAKLKALRKYMAQLKSIKRMLVIEAIKENPKSAVTK